MATIDCADPLNCAQCRTDGGEATRDTVPAKGFLPGQVIATLPVYPGAVGSVEMHVGSGLPSFPNEVPVCRGPRCPGLETASALYTSDATADDAFAW
ncbi:MAG: hypothetical protein Q8P22_10175 [Chloroflexota bacterium]|nr:hypothetical protein [Chloroflexota bacterium]